MRLAAAVSQDHEGSLTQDAEPVYPASEQDFSWNEFGNVFDEDASCCHANPSVWNLLEPRFVAVPSRFRLRADAQFGRCRRALRFSLVGPAHPSSFRFERTSQRGLSSSSSIFLIAWPEFQHQAGRGRSVGHESFEWPIDRIVSGSIGLSGTNPVLVFSGGGFVAPAWGVPGIVCGRGSLANGPRRWLGFGERCLSRCPCWRTFDGIVSR